jgi:hypothetical protein
MSTPFRAFVQVVNEGVEVPPNSGVWSKGSILIDDEGSVWVCKEGGEPGVWTKQIDSNNAVELNLIDKISAGLVNTPDVSVDEMTAIINNAIINIYDRTDANATLHQIQADSFSFTVTEVEDYYITYEWGIGWNVRPMNDSIDYITQIPIMALCWDGSNLAHKILNNRALHLAERIVKKEVEYYGNQAQKGFGISTDSATIIIDSGIAWNGTEYYELPQIRSDTDVCLFFYHDSSGNWIVEQVTGFNNLNYDTDTGLQTVSDNNYVVNWIFRSTIRPNYMVILLGRGDYSLDMAIASGVPPIPHAIEAFTFLVGRIIVKKGETTPELIQQAKNIFFGYSPAMKHNDLAGMQGGDANDKYHLTYDEYQSVDKLNRQLYPHNNLYGIQGGNANEKYHLGQTEHDTLVGGNTSIADSFHTHQSFNLIQVKDIASTFLKIDQIAQDLNGNYPALAISSSYFRANCTGTVNLYGIIPPDFTKSTVLILTKLGTPNLTINNESGSASDVRYRILTGGGNLTLSGDGSALLIYDPVSLRWRVVSYIA